MASAISLLLMLVLELFAGGAPAAQAQPITASANPSCATAPDPTGGPHCGGPLDYSARDLTILARKKALVQEAIAVRAGTLAAATFQRDWQAFIREYGGPTTAANQALEPRPYCNSGGCNTSLYINLTQQAQTTYYYCGPASAAEALQVRNVSESQNTLAGNSYLQTNEYGGTNWGSLVMPGTLNYFTNSSFYEALDANSTNNYNAFASDLYTDIGQGWSVVIAVYEENNTTTPHLVGHPTNIVIKHWVASYGYTEYGANTAYADSVHNATSISWHQSVPAYSTISSYNMWIMMNQGGYGWVW